MSRRRGRRGRTVNESQSGGPPSAVGSSGPPALPSTDAEANTPLLLAFKTLFENAANKAKSALESTGKVGPRAIFVYDNEAGNLEAGTTKTVALVWRNELQKEALIRRIREKAMREQASAVLTVTETEPEPGRSLRRRGTFLLSGVAPGLNLFARVDYAFANDMKGITSWEMRYLDKPVHNVFVDGIFPVERGSV